MPKMLLDLSREDSDILEKISKRWELSKTDAIKRMINEYAKANKDNLDLDLNLNIDDII